MTPLVSFAKKRVIIMKGKQMRKQIKNAVKSKIFKVKGFPLRENVWEAMEYSGWNTYEAYCNLLNMKRAGFIENYLDVSRKNINAYKKKLAIMMLEEKKDPQIKNVFLEIKFLNRFLEARFLNWFFSDRQKRAIKQLENGKLTSRILSDFLMIRLPKEVGDLDTDISKIIRTGKFSVATGTVFLWFEGKIPNIEIFGQKKPLFVVCSPKFRKSAKEAGFSYVVKENLSAYVFELSRIWHERKNDKTVAITGTVGKTTTTDMIKSVVGDAFSMYAIDGNQNTSCQIAAFVFNLQPEHTAYVQEAAAATPRQLEGSSRVLNPDIFVLTNIGHGHLGNYGGSREFILYEKLAVDRHAKDDAVGVVNMDDDMLRASSFTHEVKWYSLSNAAADFYGKDIREENGKTAFTIVEKDNVETKLYINSIGKHNVYNALAAFAVGVIMEIDREKIVASLEGFQHKGVRQHFAEYGGRNWYFDCYSITEDSVLSHVKTLSTFKLEDGGRRILVLGDISTLGKEAEAVQRRVGNIVANNGCLDEVFMYGKDVRFAYEVACDNGLPCRYTDNLEDIREWITNETSSKDLVGFKANHFSKFQWVIDDLCGTDFFFNEEDTLYDIRKELDEIVYKINEEYGAGILKSKTLKSSVLIPETIEDTYIRLAGRMSFAGNSELEEISLPDGLVCIGESAFTDCKRLKRVKFGSGLKFIGEKTFHGCSEIEEIDLSGTQLGTIERDAFLGCKKLKTIILPDTQKWISEEAFDESVTALQG